MLTGYSLTGEFSSEYLNYLLASDYAREWCWGIKADGISQSNISASKLATFLAPVPPMSEQLRIVTKVDELMAICDELESQLGRARSTRASFATSAVASFA